MSDIPSSNNPAGSDAMNLYRAIMQQSHDGIAMIDIATRRFLTANQSFLDLLGYSREELVNLTVYDVVDDCRESIDAYYESDLPRKGFLPPEVRTFIRKDGTRIAVDRSGTLIDYAGKQVYVINVRDITARRQMEEQILRQNRQLKLLHQMALNLMKRREMDNLLREILKSTAEFAGTQHGAILLRRPGEDFLEHRVGIGMHEAVESEFRCIRLGQGAVGAAWRTGKPVIIDSYKEWAHKLPRAVLAQAKANVTIPLRYSGETLGVLNFTYTEPNPLSPEDLAMLEQAANLAALSLVDAFLYQRLQNELAERKRAEERLTYLSLHDYLTGLYNRGYFEEELRRLDARRSGTAGVIIFDLDGLKLVNDSFGHAQGDVLLIDTARAIKSCFRESDVVARIGGDEFAALLPDVPAGRTEAACAKVRAKVAALNAERQGPPISLSIGYAVGPCPGAMKELFREADNWMYRDKLYRSKNARSAIVEMVLKLLDTKDFITEGHTERLNAIMSRMGAALNLPPARIADLKLLAQFHDLGKVGIADAILAKPGPLTDKERAEIRRHCEIGHRIAMASPDLAPIADWVLKHHEWWNGSGYPLGLAGDAIPLECRILAIADAYDAITSDRPYRRAQPHAVAAAEIRRCSGTQFDPELVKVFLSLFSGNS